MPAGSASSASAAMTSRRVFQPSSTIVVTRRNGSNGVSPKPAGTTRTLRRSGAIPMAAR
jgi:hypothetical protein